MKKLTKILIVAIISGTVSFSPLSYASTNNYTNHTSNQESRLGNTFSNKFLAMSNIGHATNSDTMIKTEDVQGSVNQGASTAKEFMSKLTAEISALFGKYGNSSSPLLNKAVQVIKIVLTYVLRTIEDILVLIHDLLKVVTN